MFLRISWIMSTNYIGFQTPFGGRGYDIGGKVIGSQYVEVPLKEGSRENGNVTENGEFPICDQEGEITAMPITIIVMKVGKVKNRPITYVLVQWSNHKKEEATWELYNDLIRRFPQGRSGGRVVWRWSGLAVEGYCGGGICAA
ncbi:reverse transcriptase, partial [Tanacetum coccineum]